MFLPDTSYDLWPRSPHAFIQEDAAFAAMLFNRAKLRQGRSDGKIERKTPPVDGMGEPWIRTFEIQGIKSLDSCPYTIDSIDARIC